MYDNPDTAKRIPNSFIPVFVNLTGKLTAEETVPGNQYNFRYDCLLIYIDYKGNIIKGPGDMDLCFAWEIYPQQFTQSIDMNEEGFKSYKY